MEIDIYSLDRVTTLLGLFLLAIGYHAISSVLAWRRLRAFPGPLFASFSYLWVIRASQTGHIHRTLLAEVDKHGTTTIRVGPNELLTGNPDVIRRITAARSRYRRSDWYRLHRLIPGQDSMLTTLDVAEHDWLKAKTAPGYTGKDVPSLEVTIDSVLLNLVSKLRAKYAANPSLPRSGANVKPLLDLARTASYFTLDSITQLAFDQNFGFLDSETDVYGHLVMLDEMARKAMVFTTAPPFIGRIVSSTPFRRLVDFLVKPENRAGIFRILPITRAIVAKRYGPEAPRQNDMLGSFVAHGLSEAQANNEAVLQVMAGSDTTATWIRATMLYILSSPRVYRRLQDEIDAGVRNGMISSTVISSAEATALPYLQAVLWEGLRIHPPASSMSFKVVPPEGDIIDGKFVPGGTRTGTMVEVAMRMKDVFGDDADVYRPERWLEADKEKEVEMRKTVDLVFSYGRYGCAGKLVAHMEAAKVVVELLRSFNFQLAYPEKPWDSVNFAVFLQRNLWVAVSLRD
ncbi:Pisatin demethylase [Podospora aff. communis PSN243]|uniref:Pisatin demethylase n=1 Tax=Podospora aff. communis PSN243 TaxID=3040156 RepID=A0AAV9H0P0_9PEZI|nr:Pisatin demethylase [Podospora aff. communis PSN243]